MRLATSTLLSVLLVSAASHAQEAEPKPDLSREVAEVQRLRKELGQLDARLQVVETQYAYRPEPPEEELLQRRFSDGEIQFLLTNYPQASVLFYDLVGNETFRRMREYPDALYMLAESLYQQQNFLGARLYFREHLNTGDPRRYRDSLSRYLEISGRINEFSGIDGYIEQAKGADGALPADVAYVYGKWLFRRTDIPDAERIARATSVFEAIASVDSGMQLQSIYFLGVLAIQRGDLPGAVAQFERILALPSRNERDEKVKELTNLSLGRVFFEQGRYTEAVDRYQEIDYRSDYFVDALYEIAWTHVRRAPENGPQEYEKAFQACEKLLLAAPDSVIAPDAKTLQGHLLLKLGRYQEAIDTYNSVINTYLEVYDNIDGLLKAHSDPVKYFQQLIAESDRTFDISALLPPIAVKWATTQKEVADAVRMTGDLDLGREGIAEANEIATRLLETLEHRGMQAFPMLQDGYSRAEAVDAALARVEGQLIAVEERILGPAKVEAIRAELERVRQERLALEEKFRSLPKDEQELEARRKRMSDRIGQVEQEAFRLGYQVESLFAVLAAVEKWMNDTRATRPEDPVAEREFAERMKQERAHARALQDELLQMQKRVRDEKAALGLTDTGEGQIRVAYEETLMRERQLLASARAGASTEAQLLLSDIDHARSTIANLKLRSKKAKDQISEAVARKVDDVREKVRHEAALLARYDEEARLASANAQDLVGRIAFESFKRVRRQFYELVLKADVGLVDVAWTRKQDKTNEIQRLASQKDKELRELDAEFKEVLKDVD